MTRPRRFEARDSNDEFSETPYYGVWDLIYSSWSSMGYATEEMAESKAEEFNQNNELSDDLTKAMLCVHNLIELIAQGFIHIPELDVNNPVIDTDIIKVTVKQILTCIEWLTKDEITQFNDYAGKLSEVIKYSANNPKCISINYTIAE